MRQFLSSTGQVFPALPTLPNPHRQAFLSDSPLHQIPSVVLWLRKATSQLTVIMQFLHFPREEASTYAILTFESKGLQVLGIVGGSEIRKEAVGMLGITVWPPPCIFPTLVLFAFRIETPSGRESSVIGTLNCTRYICRISKPLQGRVMRDLIPRGSHDVGAGKHRLPAVSGGCIVVLAEGRHVLLSPVGWPPGCRINIHKFWGWGWREWRFGERFVDVLTQWNLQESNGV